MSGRARRLAVVAGLAAVLVVAGAVVSGTGRAPDAEPGAGPGPVAVEAGMAPGLDPAASAEALQARLRRLPRDWQAWAWLGAIHLQQAAATADPSYYSRAAGAFDRSLEVHPDGNDPALVGQAALAGARHDFPAARALAQRALQANAYSAPALGVLTDALVELGEYEAAFAALQRMLDVRPAVPSYTRASYSFELRGDLPGARSALERALRIAADPADAAFVRRYLGELAFGQGDVDEAGRQFAAGLRGAPDSVPLLAGQARVQAARGEVDAAVLAWTQVVGRLPDPAYLVELGDLLASLGRTAEAAEQYALVRATQQLFAAAGADLDVEQSLFAADHGDPAGALQAAERAWQTRRSVHVADAYAWALHVNGRSAEAVAVVAQAHRLGTRSALFDYHRGMIEQAVGDRVSARRSLGAALAANPHFSPLHAPTARAALAALGGPVPV